MVCDSHTDSKGQTNGHYHIHHPSHLCQYICIIQYNCAILHQTPLYEEQINWPDQVDFLKEVEMHLQIYVQC